MDRAMLEREYNARESVASFDAEMAEDRAESARVQKMHKRIADIVYDPQSGQTLDLFLAGPDSPIFIWIHGGYWRAGTKEHNSFAAGGLLAQGVSVAVLDYALAPEVKIGEIVRQVRTATAWIKNNSVTYGYNAQTIHVGGSSAGAHLTGMLLVDGWTTQMGLPDDMFGAVLALSGLYELEPLQHIQVNEWMRFTAEEIAANSPVRHIPDRSKARLIASVGGLETAEFQRQTNAFVDGWRAAGHQTDRVEMPNWNHFNLARSLSDPNGDLVGVLHAAIMNGKKGNFV
tara:strand:- start:562 stop:1422 length:861 start_codon:yes stop_codon:yes gene_type:complete